MSATPQRDGPSAPQLRQRWSEVAQVTAVPSLRTTVCRFLAAGGVPDATVSSLKLALSEALTNAVEHAYPGHDVPGRVSVMASVVDHHVHVVVTDDGVGFAPRLDSPGLGVGLPVMAAVCDSLEILPGDPRGTEVHMGFAL